jgi:hypothetical protein
LPSALTPNLNLSYRLHPLLEAISKRKEKSHNSHGNKLTNMRKQRIGKGCFMGDTKQREA